MLPADAPVVVDQPLHRLGQRDDLCRPLDLDPAAEEGIGDHAQDDRRVASQVARLVGASRVEMTSFPWPSTPTRTGEVCSPRPGLRVMSTARWLLLTNSRASSGPIRSPLPPSADRSGCCAWWHTWAQQRRRARVSQERPTRPGGESSGRSSSYPSVVCSVRVGLLCSRSGRIAMDAAARNRPVPSTGSRPGQLRGRGTEVRRKMVADRLPGPLTRVPEAEPPFPRR